MMEKTTGMHGMMDMTTMGGHAAKRSRMWSWYHVDVEDTVLFKSWTVFDAGTMVWTCFVIAAAGICLEALKYFRWASGELVKRHQDDENSRKNFWHHHFIDTLYHGCQLVLAYVLMNVYMVFSVYICLSLCLGLSVGHLIFGSRTHLKKI
uniref:Copper transport protein n=1 Tax=Caenorhabditis japonica TaxID=281687 RepID=A0A8R1HHL0_CAEJA